MNNERTTGHPGTGQLTDDDIDEILHRAYKAGIIFKWDIDEDADLSWMDKKERQKEHDIEYCYAHNEHTGENTSLGGIVDADSAYKGQIEAELALDLGIERPVAIPHEELHTDTSDYDEAIMRGLDDPPLVKLKEANVYVPETEEAINLKEMPESELKAGYDRWEALGGDNTVYGYRPGEYAIFGRSFSYGGGERIMEIDVMISVGMGVALSVTLWPGDRHHKATCLAYYTPVNPEPMLDVLYRGMLKEEGIIDLAFSFQEWKKGVDSAVKATWRDWIRLWQPVEHEELHTDTSGYDEARRRPTVYQPPKKGLPGLTATRYPSEETHREDYNNIVYDLMQGEDWIIKIGRASISSPRITFSVAIHARATTENPYEGEVPSLVGPPFYTLRIQLKAKSARGEVNRVNVIRHFDAAGHLCWAKSYGTSSFRDVFSPMGDLKHMEQRAFGEASPETDGYFFAMASGSVSDCFQFDSIKKGNLWQLFKPYVLNLAQRPEVRELEKPFKTTAHEELHGDPGEYLESFLKNGVQETYYNEEGANPAFYDLTWITSGDLPELKAELDKLDFGKTAIGISKTHLGITDVIHILGDPQKAYLEIHYTYALTVGKSFFIEYEHWHRNPAPSPNESYNLSGVPAELPDWTDRLTSIPDRYKDRVYRTLNALYIKWISPFRRVQHSELHTDTGAYEESEE